MPDSEGQKLSGKNSKCNFRWRQYFFRKIFAVRWSKVSQRSVLSEYFPEKIKPSERRRGDQNHPKRAKEQRRQPRNTPEEEKRTPKFSAKGPSQKSNEPSIAMEDDLAILKLDRSGLVMFSRVLGG